MSNATVTATIITEFEELSQQVLSDGRTQLVDSVGHLQPSSFRHPDWLAGVRAGRRDFRTLAQAEAYKAQNPWWASHLSPYEEGYRSGVLCKAQDMRDAARKAMAAY